MRPLEFLSSLDAGPLRDHLLEAVRLERRRSTTSKALTGLLLFGFGAVVGGSALFTLLKRFPRVAPPPAGTKEASAKPDKYAADRTHDAMASA